MPGLPLPILGPVLDVPVLHLPFKALVVEQPSTGMVSVGTMPSGITELSAKLSVALALDSGRRVAVVTDSHQSRAVVLSPSTGIVEIEAPTGIVEL